MPATPVVPPPSATVEPFQSAGGPPPPESKPKRGKGGLVLIVVLLVLLALAGLGYYLVSTGKVKLGSTVTPKASSSAAPSATPTSNIDTAYSQTDAAVGQLSNDLDNADTALGDKQGDLSE